MPDMLSKQVAGGHNVALAAKVKDLVVLFICSFHAVSQIQLQAGIAFSAVVDVADDGHETWLVGARVEDRVKLPVEAAPGGNMFLLPQFTDVPLQNRVSFREVLLRKKRYR